MKKLLAGLSILFISIMAMSAGEAIFHSGMISKGSLSVGSTTAANSKAIVEMISTTKGMLPPRMTSTQRDAIATPPPGLELYNTTTSKKNIYDGTAWRVVTFITDLVAANFSSGAATNGQVLTANGSGGTSWTTLNTSLDQSQDFQNCTLATSISSNTLVIALKDKAGSDPSAGSPCNINFRNSTLATGDYATKSFTAASSVTVGTTDSLGVEPSVSQYSYVYAISDTTSELCVSHELFDTGNVRSATAFTGGAETASNVLYCTNAHTNRPIRLIGRFAAVWSNPNWGSIAETSIIPFATSNFVSTRPNFGAVEVASLNCDSSSAITSQRGAWISSIGNISSGTCTVTLRAGVFSTTPYCFISESNTGGLTTNMAAVASSTTSVSIRAYNVITETFPTAWDGYLLCIEDK